MTEAVAPLLSEGELVDLLVTCREGGLTWASFGVCPYFLDLDDPRLRLPVPVVLYEDPVAAGAPDVVTLDCDTLECGLESVRWAYPRVFQRLVAGEYDAYDADMVVQYAVFGELVYG